MANANFIIQFEYRLNNLTGSETQSELLALRATADKYVDDLDSASIALLDAAIDLDADALTNSSTIKELVTVGNADAVIAVNSQKLFRFVDAGGNRLSAGESVIIACDDDERVIITGLESSLSGGTSDWSLIEGGEVIYNQGDIVVDDSNPSLQLGGRISVNGNSPFSSGYLTMGVGSDVVINNLHASGQISVTYQIEQTYEG